MSSNNPGYALLHLLRKLEKLDSGKFYEETAEVMGLEREDFSGVASALTALVKRLEEAIASLEIPETQRQLLWKQFRPFELKNIYANLNGTLSKAKNGLFHPNSFDQLGIIAMALDGKIPGEDVSEELTTYLVDLSDIRDQLHQLDIPQSLKESVDKRLEQIITAVSHLKYWGPEGLEQVLVSLTGEITLYHEQFKTDSGKSFTKRVGSILPKFRSAVAKARGYEKDAGWLIEKGSDFKEIWEKLVQ